MKTRRGILNTENNGQAEKANGKRTEKNGDPRMNGNGDIFDKYQYMGKAMDYNKKN